MATIYDIAKKCECSTTTVSKVLNNSGKISESKKKLILETAKSMGYIASQNARSLASSNKSSHLIGVMLNVSENKSMTHEMFSSILNSFRIEMEKNGYDICFLRTLKDDDYLSYKSLIDSRGIDGLFVLSIDPTTPKMKELFEEDIPYVAFDMENVVPMISSNNKEIVAKMVDYLASQGHTRICYICPSSYGVSKYRYRGFLLGLERNNIAFDERMIVKAPYYSKDSAKIATDKSLASGINPTVIMYPDDYTAISAITYLRKLGKKVPNVISITGFDGIEMGGVISTPLTTVKQDTDEIGYRAAQILLKRLKRSKNIEDHTVIGARLIIGDTVKNIK